RVDRFVVVHFEDFDVEILVERLRYLLDQRRQQVDPHAHVAGLDDHGALCRLLDQLFILTREPGGADDMDAALARRMLGESDGGGGGGEGDRPLRRGKAAAGGGGDRPRRPGPAGPARRRRGRSPPRRPPPPRRREWLRPLPRWRG